jgi:DNA-binding NarL/FixJ family response regulator
MVRVLLVNEIRLMANVIAATLEDEKDIQVIGLATNPEEAYALAPACDVALVSTRLPNNGALELIQTVSESFPDVKVLALGLGDSEAEILQYVEAGAAGYVLKDDSLEEVLRNIRAAHAGEALISPDIAAALMARVNELAQQFEEVAAVPDVVEFTPREREVLELVSQDLSNQEIAERLFIEVGTVKNHVHSILKKLNMNSRHDAAAFWAIVGKDGP